MARPTKRTKERIETICDALRSGNTRRAAAAAAGISEDTLRNWEQSYSGFSELLARAEADAERGYLKIIETAAKPRKVVKRKVKKVPGVGTIIEYTEYEEIDWNAARWWLSRRRRDAFGDRHEAQEAEDAAPPILEIEVLGHEPEGDDS